MAESCVSTCGWLGVSAEEVLGDGLSAFGTLGALAFAACAVCCAGATRYPAVDNASGTCRPGPLEAGFPGS